MNIINKNLIYIVCSILLGLSISYFYIKKINKLFLLYFFIITIFIYILFYFLGNSQENFANSTPMEYIEKEITTEEEEFILEGEEEIVEYILKYPNSYNEDELEQESPIQSEDITEEEYYPTLEEESNNYYDSENILNEEEYNVPYTSNIENSEENYYEEEYNSSNDNNLSTNSSNMSSTNNLIGGEYLLQEEEEHINKLNINPDKKEKNNLQFTAPNGVPFNINISYNSQNSTNNLENNKVQTSNKESISENSNRIPYENIQTQKIKKEEIPMKKMQNKCNRNLGTYNYSDSRIYNNSDWIYGNYAWTNEPDYYIPEESNYQLPRPAKKDISSYNNCPSIPISQPLNKLISSKNFKNNTNVCPMAINTPWTEYKSGDSEPEPFNL